MIDILRNILNLFRLMMAGLFAISGIVVPFVEPDESWLIIILAMILCFLIAYAFLPKRHKNKLKSRIVKRDFFEEDTQEKAFSETADHEVPVRQTTVEDHHIIQEKMVVPSHQSLTPELEQWDSLSGLEFDNQLAKLLKNQGYSQIRLRLNSTNQGTDILGTKEGTEFVFQGHSSFGSSLIEVSAIHQILSGSRDYDVVTLVVVTNSYFTDEAKAFAAETDVVLWD